METSCVVCSIPATGTVRSRPLCDNCKLEFARKKALVFNNFPAQQRKAKSVSVFVMDLAPSSIFTLNCAEDFCKRTKKTLNIFSRKNYFEKIKKIISHEKINFYENSEFFPENLENEEIFIEKILNFEGEIFYLSTFSEKIAAEILAELLKGNGNLALKIGREAFYENEKLIGLPGTFLSREELKFVTDNLQIEFEEEILRKDPFIGASMELLEDCDHCVSQSIQRSTTRVFYEE